YRSTPATCRCHAVRRPPAAVTQYAGHLPLSRSTPATCRCHAVRRPPAAVRRTPTNRAQRQADVPPRPTRGAWRHHPPCLQR
ncbi:hypothetical protein AB0P21_07185, partial [Kribbella sp. NPDC056861]|uniref:hypothetical protein n=1 Tax=Kribbella sp. NPDC056861 TaxID=3154857 RepID=UPI00344550EA